MWYSSSVCFVPVGDGPVILFFYTYHTKFNIKLPTQIALLYCCLVRGRISPWLGTTCGIIRGCVFVSVGDGPVILFFIQPPPAATCFSPLYRPVLAYFKNTTSFPSRKQILSDFRRGFCIFRVLSVKDLV